MIEKDEVLLALHLDETPDTDVSILHLYNDIVIVQFENQFRDVESLVLVAHIVQ